MTPLLAGGAIGATAGTIGWVATVATATPTDYAGIALIISAASTFLGTLGGLIFMLRRSRTISRTEATEIARALRGQLPPEGADPDAS